MDPTTQLMQATGITDKAMAASLLASAEGDVELAAVLYQSSVSAKPAAAPQSAPASKPKAKPTGGIMTMSQLTALDTGDDSDDEDRQTYYAGGAKGSGVQVQDPRKKPDVAKVVESVFDKARKGGAMTDEEHAAEGSKSFGGSGYRLGNTNTEPTRPSVKGKQERLKKVVTFWRQGFVVDDGPLRSYSDPANHRFLQDVEEGYVPQELEAEAAGRELETELVDHKHEDYKEPERPKYNAFGGSGHSLSSSATSSTAAPPPAKATGSFILDPTAPTISIQVRFHDGTKATAKVNTTHTIMDLRAWIEANKSTPSAYDLLTGFPTKPLTNNSQTVQEAGLSGSVVQQKLR